jgi:hypothetical protein
MAEAHAKPTQSQQGTYNAGKTQAFGSYTPPKQGQSGAVQVKRN